MGTMARDDALSFIRSQTPDFLPKARKRGFVCPKCHNGEGKDGDGIMRNPKNGSYKCFKCDFSGDIFDLIGAEYGIDDFNGQFDKAAEYYGISVEKYHQQVPGSPQPQKTASKTNTIIKDVANKVASDKPLQQEENLETYFQQCHDRINGTTYLTKRGITEDIIDKFNIGYDPALCDGKLKTPMNAIIFPTSANTFEARNIDILPNAPGFRYYKHGSAFLFNGKALSEEKTRPVFITEGIIDALSIMSAGGVAVGLGSAANYKLLLAELDKVIPEKPLILLLDNDNTGAETEMKLAAELNSRKITYLAQPVDEAHAKEHALFDFHDPNDMLQKDPVRFKEMIEEQEGKAAVIPSPKELAIREYVNTSAGKSVPAFISYIKKGAGRPRLSTGFKAIDDALDGGLYTGLYCIGAISSLGKTTLTLQIADNLAKQGRDVLYFSLEQSKYELMSKSISRETFFYCRDHALNSNNAKSNLAILDGRRWNDFNQTEKDVVNGAFKAYQGYASHLFIYEGIGNISVEEIKEKLKTHIAITGNTRPIIFIDYLQILKAADLDQRATDKQIIDHNITALKQLSRDFDIPIFVVSSLNRQNYSQEINMAAFKESGAIEYGSDVLIGLQFTGAGETGFDVNKAKDEDPRKIDFCILKNRNGRITPKGIPMSFYPVFNCFMADETDDDDGFAPISVEQEDELPF